MVGRPQHDVPMVNVHMQIPKDLNDEINRLSRLLGVTRSDIVRCLLRIQIQRFENEMERFSNIRNEYDDSIETLEHQGIFRKYVKGHGVE